MNKIKAVLYGAKLKIYTDNKPLKALFLSENKCNVGLRLLLRHKRSTTTFRVICCRSYQERFSLQKVLWGWGIEPYYTFYHERNGKVEELYVKNTINNQNTWGGPQQDTPRLSLSLSLSLSLYLSLSLRRLAMLIRVKGQVVWGHPTTESAAATASNHVLLRKVDKVIDCRKILISCLHRRQHSFKNCGIANIQHSTTGCHRLTLTN